ncbi:MAG: lipopolysaccharide biosynthesis protein [Dysgonamonadaceae bacterium]|jgi:PST family polysaccharide transporter|nr:lipopolysaccharide biosynthesis protein [Dysgonamonadaceae bacterium]
MSVKKEMVNGVFWTAIQKYSGIVVQLIVSAVLARLLPVEDFGIVAIAIVLIQFLTIFADMGVGSAIVQNKNLSVRDLNDIYSFTVYAGIVLSVLFFFAADWVAAFYDKSALIVICRILSVNLFFLAINVVPNALILKDKKFKFIAKRTLILQLISGVISIVFAYKGFGLYSLLISPIFTAIGVFIFNYRKNPQRFFIRFCLAPLKKIFSFSFYQFLFSFINYFSRNMDKLIIGKYLTLSDLGYYEKSYRLMMLPMENVTSVITPVMHPVLTTLQNDKAGLATHYNKIIKLLATISFPLGILLYFLATEIIRIVFGNQWDNSIPVFKILTLSLPFQMILSSTGAIYKAAGKTNWMFYNGLSNSIFTVAGFVLSAYYFKRIEAVAWSWNISLLINTFVSYLILYKIALKSSIVTMIKTMFYPFINAVLIAWTIESTQHFYAFNMYLSLIVKVLIALLVSYLCVSLSGQYNIKEMVKQGLEYIHQRKGN